MNWKCLENVNYVLARVLAWIVKKMDRKQLALADVTYFKYDYNDYKLVKLLCSSSIFLFFAFMQVAILSGKSSGRAS